jgi:hypothetical protein
VLVAFAACSRVSRISVITDASVGIEVSANVSILLRKCQ